MDPNQIPIAGLCTACNLFFHNEAELRRKTSWLLVQNTSPADWAPYALRIHAGLGSLSRPAAAEVEGGCCSLCFPLRRVSLLAENRHLYESPFSVYLATNPGGRSPTVPGQVCSLFGFFVPEAEALLAEMHPDALASANYLRVELALEAPETWTPELTRLLLDRAEQGDARTDSRFAFALAAQWLRGCVDTHEECRSVESPLPARVIDVGPADGSQDPVLYETRGEDAQYITLSYCWGDAPTLTTTTENLADMKKRIPFSAMPKTHRDAVLIARGFNVRYLYIDAMCIIQNSYSDWESHSAKMCVIYRNSLFTIAASHAKDVSGGCFIERDGLLNQPFRLTRYESPAETSTWLVRLHHPINQTLPPQSSLESRAWIYQEQMLSRRVLYYEANGLRWHCTRCKHSEQYPGLSTGRDPMSLFQENYLVLDRVERHSLLLARKVKAVEANSRSLETSSNSGSPPSTATLSANLKRDEKEIEPLDPRQREAVMKFRQEKAFQDKYEAQRSTRSSWHEMVEEYTSKDLSHENDRLAAIFGIADAIAFKTKETYLAGLWKRTLAIDLMWSIPPQQGPLPESSQTASKRLEVAPSWSWASVNGPIQYPSGNHLAIKNVLIEHVHVDGSASRNTGKITFRGILRTAYVTKRADSNTMGLAFAPSWNPQERIPLPKCTWRPDEPVAEGAKISLLEIAREYDPEAKRLPKPKCFSIYTIAVVPIGKVYRRVGLAFWPSEDPMQGEVLEPPSQNPPERTVSSRSRFRDKFKLSSRKKSIQNLEKVTTTEVTVWFGLKKDISGERWIKTGENDGLVISQSFQSPWPEEIASVVVV